MLNNAADAANCNSYNWHYYYYFVHFAISVIFFSLRTERVIGFDADGQQSS